MKKIYTLLLLSGLAFSGNVFADCSFSGKTYAEGATIPGYVCQGGVWVKK